MVLMCISLMTSTVKYLPYLLAFCMFSFEKRLFRYFAHFYVILKRFYLFIFRERGREGEREGEKHWCARETLIGCLLHTSNWRSGPQLRHVPWLGIEPVTFHLAGPCPTRWTTPVRTCPFLHQVITTTTTIIIIS